MEIPKCPFCRKKQTKDPIKTWTYGKMIVSRTSEGTKWDNTTTCSRYNCKCGKLFNYYNTAKGQTWTIPKLKELRE